jgi:hypothetical protein
MDNKICSECMARYREGASIPCPWCLECNAIEGAFYYTYISEPYYKGDSTMKPKKNPFKNMRIQKAYVSLMNADNYLGLGKGLSDEKIREGARKEVRYAMLLLDQQMRFK